MMLVRESSIPEIVQLNTALNINFMTKFFSQNTCLLLLGGEENTGLWKDDNTLSMSGQTSGSGCVLTSCRCAAPRTTLGPTADPATWWGLMGRSATATGSARGAAPGRATGSVSARLSTAGRCAVHVVRVTTRASETSPSCCAPRVTSRVQATALDRGPRPAPCAPRAT